MRDGCRDGRRQRRVLRQDPLLEPAHLLRRLDSELLVEQAPQLAVRRQRVCLSPGAVEGKHEQRAQPLAERLLTHERLELGHCTVGAAVVDSLLEVSLERDQAQLAQPGDLRACERLVLDVEQRPPSPERQRLRDAVLAQQALEAVGVELPGSTRRT
ncbi:MAG TPA: hypothetical protein VHS03_13230 [Gaiellaceae bacterium]|nr:hypothetical protein [Gaiellaceae bacterium]